MIVGLLDFAGTDDLLCLTMATGRETFLEVFVKQVAKLKNVDRMYVVYRPETAHVLEVLKSCGVAAAPIVSPADAKVFYADHEKVKKARLWAYNSIRGGVNDMTIYDEIMPMLLIKAFAKSLDGIRGLLHLHPSMPLFDPGYADSLCQAARGDIHGDPFMIFRQSMVGACPALVTARGLEGLTEFNWAPFQIIQGDNIGDGLMNMAHVIPHDMAGDIMRERLTLFTAADMERLRTLLLLTDGTGMPRTVAGYADVLRRRHMQLESGSLPIEVDVDLSPSKSKLGNKLEEIFRWCLENGLLLTIGATKSALHKSSFEHEEFLRTMARTGTPRGLQVRVDASDVVRSPKRAQDWVSLCDVFAVTMDLDPEKFAPYVRELAETSNANERHALIQIELPFCSRDWQYIHTMLNWHEEHGVGFNWVPDPDGATYAPVKRRGPCEKRQFQLFIDSGMNVRRCKCAEQVLLEELCLSDAWMRLKCAPLLDACAACKHWATT